MAVTINLDSFNGETESTVEAKVRNLPANQGLNDYPMWQKIDAEIVAVQAAQASLFKTRTTYNVANKHGNK